MLNEYNSYFEMNDREFKSILSDTKILFKLFIAYKFYLNLRYPYINNDAIKKYS